MEQVSVEPVQAVPGVSPFGAAYTAAQSDITVGCTVGVSIRGRRRGGGPWRRVIGLQLVTDCRLFGRSRNIRTTFKNLLNTVVATLLPFRASPNERGARMRFGESVEQCAMRTEAGRRRVSRGASLLVSRGRAESGSRSLVALSTLVGRFVGLVARFGPFDCALSFVSGTLRFHPSFLPLLRLRPRRECACLFDDAPPAFDTLLLSRPSARPAAPFGDAWTTASPGFREVSFVSSVFLIWPTTAFPCRRLGLPPQCFASGVCLLFCLIVPSLWRPSRSGPSCLLVPTRLHPGPALLRRAACVTTSFVRPSSHCFPLLARGLPSRFRGTRFLRLRGAPQ